MMQRLMCVLSPKWIDRSIGVVKPRLAFSLAILNEDNDEEENTMIHILLLVVM